MKKELKIREGDVFKSLHSSTTYTVMGFASFVEETPIVVILDAMYYMGKKAHIIEVHSPFAWFKETLNKGGIELIGNKYTNW